MMQGRLGSSLWQLVLGASVCASRNRVVTRRSDIICLVHCGIYWSISVSAFLFGENSELASISVWHHLFVAHSLVHL